MSKRDHLIAFLATLAAVIVLYTIAAICLSKGLKVEALGAGAGATALIGILGTFKPVREPGTGG